MENTEQPAFAIQEDLNKARSTNTHLGLTKLEYASIMAMQGILASGKIHTYDGSSPMESVAVDSVMYAEELLKQLDTETNGTILKNVANGTTGK